LDRHDGQGKRANDTDQDKAEQRTANHWFELTIRAQEACSRHEWMDL
jgi:hypothetical protein